MRGNTSAFFIFLLIIVSVDLYSFQAVKLFSADWEPDKRKVLYAVYWLITFINISIVISSFFLGSPASMPNWFKIGVMAPIFIIFFSKILLVLFLFMDDLRRVITWVISKLNEDSEYNLSRNKFITSVGVIVAGSMLSSLIYGIAKGAYNYTVHKKKVKLKNLSKAFDGFKIVQISDIHTGSFMSERPLEKAFSIINELKPDLILFTGDLVNNKAEELNPFLETFKKLEAPHGVFSVLGNHDYGDYVVWDNDQAKKDNLDDLKLKQKSFGWRLLLDETIKIEKEGEFFNLIGIENWGAKARFPKYGDLRKAVQGIDESKPSILMSHDPSHWDAQVKKDFNFIDLTLSGHTHGMQFGIEIPGWIKWSPVKYVYKQWADLYEESGQKLYVNRGLGFLGYPGRVGISPEITLFELQS